MNREKLFQAVGEIDGRYVAEALRYAPEEASGSPERIVHMKKKRIITFALAAVLLLSLSIAAYAAWNIHAARQRELREDLRIDESRAEGYVEFEAREEPEGGLVLLSAVNDGEEQHVYVNISPVSEEETAGFAGGETRFVWRVEGTELGGFAAPQLPSDLSLSGKDAIREALLEYAYDSGTHTLTLQCYLPVNAVKQTMEELGTETIPLTVSILSGEGETRSFGPVDFRLTEEQLRVFDFGHAVYHDAELDKEIEILGLELTPFSAVWKVRYEGDAAFHTPEADWDAYRDWSALEDKVCMETMLCFSDGSAFSTGGALTCPYRDGAVNLWCGWGKAINIADVQRIVLGELVLWEAKSE